ncbi:hypothetical protein NPIL_269821, partial [Nephila pilipes]
MVSAPYDLYKDQKIFYPARLELWSSSVMERFLVE